MLCLAAIGFLHRSLDEAHTTLLRRWVRLWVRILFAVFFITFPLYPNRNATFDLGINTAFLALVVISETIGKISLHAPRSDTLESGVKSKEERAYAAGFKVEDLTPYEKYVDPTQYAPGSLTWSETGAKMSLITMGVSVSSARFLFRRTIAKRLPLQYRAHTLLSYIPLNPTRIPPIQFCPGYAFHCDIMVYL
jgi:hypothetical protein